MLGIRSGKGRVYKYASHILKAESSRRKEIKTAFQ